MMLLSLSRSSLTGDRSGHVRSSRLSSQTEMAQPCENGLGSRLRETHPRSYPELISGPIEEALPDKETDH
jgi:hypothetical protein